MPVRNSDRVGSLVGNTHTLENVVFGSFGEVISSLEIKLIRFIVVGIALGEALCVFA